MAIYHLHVSAIQRGERSSVAASAYRSCSRIVDERSGHIHDYSRKRGLAYSQIIVPTNCTRDFVDRSELWNEIENHHKRGDAVTAREVEVALHDELSLEENTELVNTFSQFLADQYQIVIESSIHEPEIKRGDNKPPKNLHCHMQLTACVIHNNGEFGKKQVLLDPIHCKRAGVDNLTDVIRLKWAELSNDALAKHNQRIDHRSHAARGIKEAPGWHLGPAAHGYEQRTGKKSDKRLRREKLAANFINKIDTVVKKFDDVISNLKKQLFDAERQHADLSKSSSNDMKEYLSYVDNLFKDPPSPTSGGDDRQPAEPAPGSRYKPK